jgi:hypothetical protein
MFPIEPNWGRAIVSEISEFIVNKDNPPHDALLSGMFTHIGSDISFGSSYKKTLFEYTFSAYLNRLCHKHGIKALGSKIVNVPLKGINVYEHAIETKEKKLFYCYQYGICPTNTFDSLALSVLEKSVVNGCKNCNYKGVDDEDVDCVMCKNGAVRSLILNNPDCKTFRSYGWEIFKEAIGKADSSIVEKFSDHYIQHNTDDFLYKQKFSPVMREYVESERFGEYFEADIERDILMLYTLEEPENEDDESQDQTQDD